MRTEHEGSGYLGWDTPIISNIKLRPAEFSWCEALWGALLPICLEDCVLELRTGVP